MKYNQAINMILDGGICYRADVPGYRYMFDEFGDLLEQFNEYGEVLINDTIHITKNDVTGTDWIVEKDGVVYEEYPIGKMRIIEQRVPLDTIKKYLFIKDRIHEQDQPAELEEGGEPWMTTEEIREALEEELEPSNEERDHAIFLLSKRYGELEEFRRSIVNEDWLEKKMLCFMNKYLYIHSGMNLETKQGECSNRACPFCFPQEKPKEEPHEKVTVEDMLSIIEEYCDVGNGRRGGYSAGRIYPLLKEKLTYLVSLQEK